jgi:hypothetical protein
VIRLLSWNVDRLALWGQLAAELVDVALLQEAPEPPAGIGLEVHPAPSEGEWRTVGWKSRPWRTAIARVAGDVELRPIATAGVESEDRTRLTVSRPGTLTAADVLREGERLFTVVSWYATWEHPPGDDALLGADASAHRLLSDVSALVNSPRGHRLVIAGDLNLLHGYGEGGNPYWGGRYATVFDRAEAMGLRMVGPRHPNGRRADPWPAELPIDSLAVPTYHTGRQGPTGATRQLDFVFASAVMADRIEVTALNHPQEWGPSDHCRLLITVLQ